MKLLKVKNYFDYISNYGFDFKFNTFCNIIYISTNSTHTHTANINIFWRFPSSCDELDFVRALQLQVLQWLCLL